ncbi:MAG TPA: phosphoglycerate dehydrogenase [Candidatus Limnocylindrales bacterium]|jgi:D-3-phosphoglycerate dehydrogenase|nr:phosphoglycerate dehydrogenase [Candidatus Limnocylindrales bacterium]
MKIVVAEKVAANAVQLLKDEPGWNVLTADQLNGNLRAALADADALIVRSAVDVNADILRGAEKLRVIGRAGVGVDNIDLEAATKAGIAVMNTPGANAVAVAEHTLALMLALARHLSRADYTTRAGKWEKKSLQGTELRGKTLGIIGLGRIGMEVAKRAKAFEMKIIAHDPFVSASVARELEIELAELDRVLAAADYLSLHVGLTPQTEGMINEQSLRKMKKGVRIINCARGELVNDAGLAEAIKSGHVAGAALDVFTQEPPKDSPLLALENVIATPHIAGSTNEAQDAVGVQIANQVREYLKRGVIQNAVNMPSIDHQQYTQMRPWLGLAEKLGAFLANVVPTSGSIQEILLRYSGRLTEWKTELIRNSAIQGILNQRAAEHANVVNAAAIAQERGIHVHEIRKDKAQSPGDILAVAIKTTAGELEVRGAVVRDSSLRLLGVGSIYIEVPLQGNLIYIRNRDVPGVVGKVGTILGRNSVNIGNLALGRAEHKTGAEAISVVQVDSPAPDVVLKELASLPEVEQVCGVRL